MAQLLRTIQEQAEEREFVRLQPGPPPRSPVWYVVLVVLLLLNGWIWVDRPARLVGEAPPTWSEAERERALRFHLYVQGQKLEAYRAEHGRLPEVLDDAGTPLPGIRYQAAGSRSWELLGESGQVRILLRASQPMGEFLHDYEALLGLEGS